MKRVLSLLTCALVLAVVFAGPVYADEAEENPFAEVVAGQEVSATAEAPVLPENVPETAVAPTDAVPPLLDPRPDLLPATVAFVSVSSQQLAVFSKKGDLLVFAPIVTGWKNKWDTTEGMFKITQKCQNKALVGGQTSTYWLRFYKGEGLHDALWRQPEEFGGATYLTNGSHGCVNVPFEVMSLVYATMEVGDIVIVQP